MSDVVPLAEDVLAWVWANKVALLGWGIAIVAFILVPFRRPPAEARSWLLIFFALPWLGLIVYWLIGRPYYAKQRQQRYEEIPGILDRIDTRSGLDGGQFVPNLTDDNLAVANLAKGLGGFSAVAGNEVELLAEYNATYDRIIEDIDRAQRHVHLQFYIFSKDAIGDRIMDALERASARGVCCRVLIDALGSYGSIQSIKRRLRRSGVEVRDILPLRRRLTSSRVDLRNHRKIVIVDEKVGYTGSQNIWDPSVHSRRANQELFLRMTGPAVAQLQAVFVSDWYLETLEDLVDPELFVGVGNDGGIPSQIVASGPHNPEGGMDLIFAQCMYNAENEIVIVTPYFVPNGALLAAIKSAVIAGIKVRLITTEKSDHLLVGLAQRSYYSELLKVGCEIHLFGPDFLHAKHFRVDREVSVIGSSNMDVRSFELNAEIDLICYGAPIADGLQLMEAEYLAKSTRLSLDDWRQRSLFSKILENSARLLSDLI